MKRLTLSKEKIKILLLEGVHKNAVRYFAENGYTNVEYHKKAFSDSSLIKMIKHFHVIGIRSRTQLTENILEHAPKLFVVGCFCIGTNQVELQTAELRGIPVFNAPFSNTRSVAELVIAEIIMLMRGVTEKNILAHKGIWEKSTSTSYEVRGKNLGIIGYGHIGSQVSILAESLGMNISYFDIEKKLNIGNARPCDSLNELLNKSDVVTLHVPATPQTKNMVGEKQIAAMKKGACFINASRGSVVDLKALRNALSEKYLSGAAIDVFPQEPASTKDRFKCELQDFDNVILTPHIGGSTEEAQENIAREVAEKIVKYSDNGSTTGAVNFVQVSLPPQKNVSRFLHIHRNVSGVLEAVNNIFSTRGININSQYLQTDRNIGYLICDIEGRIDKDILLELKNISSTIRARILY